MEKTAAAGGCRRTPERENRYGFVGEEGSLGFLVVAVVRRRRERENMTLGYFFYTFLTSGFV